MTVAELSSLELFCIIVTGVMAGALFPPGLRRAVKAIDTSSGWIFALIFPLLIVVMMSFFGGFIAMGSVPATALTPFNLYCIAFDAAVIGVLLPMVLLRSWNDPKNVSTQRGTLAVVFFAIIGAPAIFAMWIMLGNSDTVHKVISLLTAL